MFHGKTKYIELDVHFIRKQVTTGNLFVHFVPSEFSIVENLTKLLSANRFSMLRGKLSLVDYKFLYEK